MAKTIEQYGRMNYCSISVFFASNRLLLTYHRTKPKNKTM